MPTRNRSRASDVAPSAAAAISSASCRCSFASIASTQLFATVAAIDWRANSASATAAWYAYSPAARWERTRPHRSSSQLANSPTPLSPLPSPPIFPPPRASRLTAG
jgi:hypothetical protein